MSDTRSVVEELFFHESIPSETLLHDIEAYAIAIINSPQADHELGAKLVEGCRGLLTLDLNVEERHWVQIAVLYFVLDDDGDDDLASPFGFDDDAEVFNAVCRAIGHPDRILQF